MHTYDAIRKRRTIRKFNDFSVKRECVLQIIEAGRLAPCSANLQSLKYLVVEDKKIRQKMYPYIKYAGYVPDWNPKFDETPNVFIVVLNDTNIKPTKSSEVDSGAALANMCLEATGLGIDSCWLGAICRDELKMVLDIPMQLDIMYILGLGYGAQHSSIVDMKNNNPKYYFDADDNVYVPKRLLKDVIIGFV